MSVNTKGILVTPSKDVFHIMGMIDNALEKWQRDKINSGHILPYVKTAPSVREMILSGDAVYVYIFLGEKGDHRVRRLQVCFLCDYDHKDLSDQSISFSIGQNAEGIEIMECALKAVASLGDTYIVRNDALTEKPERFS